MAVIDVKRFQGLDLRNSDLNRDPSKAMDLLNVKLNKHGELVKRNGYEDHLDETDIGATKNMAIYRYQDSNELLYIKTDGSIYTGSGSSVIKAFNLGFESYVTPPSIAEHDGNVYFADPSLNNQIMKYDGTAMYRIGLPKIKVDSHSYTVVGAGTGSPETLYTRAWFTHIDNNGYTVHGDYTQLDTQAVNDDSTWYLDTTLKDLNNSFYGYGYDVAHIKPYIDQAKNMATPLTLLVSKTVGKYDIGSYFWVTGVPTTGPITFDVSRRFKLVVTEIDTSNPSYDAITLDPEYKTNQYRIFFEADNHYSNTFISIACSFSETYGYRMINYPYFLSGQNTEQCHIPVDKDSSGISTIRNTLRVNLVADTNPEIKAIRMEQIYDATRVKGVAPRARYIAIYNGALVCGGLLWEDVETDRRALEFRYVENNNIAWSDLGVGGSVETFNPFDDEIIGSDKEEGRISGLYASSDNVIIFKQNAVHYLNGFLFNAGYRLRKAFTNRIGCLDHSTIEEVEGGCMFLTKKGIYHAADGGAVRELTDMIEPYFDVSGRTLEPYHFLPTDVGLLTNMGVDMTFLVRSGYTYGLVDDYIYVWGKHSTTGEYSRFLCKMKAVSDTSITLESVTGGADYLPMIQADVPLFNSCHAAHDNIREKIYCSLNDGTMIVYDYYWKDWFLYEFADVILGGLNSDGGAIKFAEDVPEFTGTSQIISKENTGYSDDGNAIEASYRSGWIDLGQASLRKKFIKSIIYSLGVTDEWKCSIRTYKDWVDNIDTSEVFEFTEETDRFADKSFNQNLCNSFSIEFGNSENNETMHLTGHTLEYELVQRNPKVR